MGGEEEWYLLLRRLNLIPVKVNTNNLNIVPLTMQNSMIATSLLSYPCMLT